jgi:hypothetical protein
MQTYEEKKILFLTVIKEIPTHGEFQIIRNDNFSFAKILNAVINTIDQLSVGMNSTKVQIFTEEEADAIWRSFQAVDDFHIAEKLPEFNCVIVSSCYDNISIFLKNDDGRLKIIVIRKEPLKGKKDSVYVCGYDCFNREGS